MSGVTVSRHEVPNGEGWMLSLRRTVGAEVAHGAGGAPRRPVLIVPGYGMNSFIFGFHPTGRSLEAHLAWRGFEVWSVDLRAQGRSRPLDGAGDRRFGLAHLGLVDVPAALDFVRAHTTTGAAQVDVIGASLGASIMFITAGVRGAADLGALVSFGGPLRWERVHPALSLAFASPALVGRVPFRGTRALARVALPLLTRVPALLSVYLNTSVTDMSRADEMVETVEDPIPQVNEEIARWIKSRDLFVRGVNVTEAAAALPNPLLSVVALNDGIVPPETARSAHARSRAAERSLLEVGSPGRPMAHADLFISRYAEAEVFEPLAAWLARQP
ncbi:MAG: alpha/beta fold hydrolase [Polyangiales bacterium]